MIAYVFLYISMYVCTYMQTYNFPLCVLIMDVFLYAMDAGEC